MTTKRVLDTLGDAYRLAGQHDMSMRELMDNHEKDFTTEQYQAARFSLEVFRDNMNKEDYCLLDILLCNNVNSFNKRRDFIQKTIVFSFIDDAVNRWRPGMDPP